MAIRGSESALPRQASPPVPRGRSSPQIFQVPCEESAIDLIAEASVVQFMVQSAE